MAGLELDPRAKLLATLVLLVPLLARVEVAVVGVYALLLVVAVGLSGAGKAIARNLALVVYLAVALALFTTLVESEGRTWVAGALPWSTVGLVQGALLGVRMVEMVALGLLLTATTPPLPLAGGVQWLLRPLRSLRVDVQALGMVVVLALRFVPLLKRELRQTEEAMFLRGARFGRGPVEQTRRLGTIAVPTLHRLLLAADETGAALVTRGFGLRGSTALALESRFGAADWLLLLAAVGFAVVVLAG